jgi:hypothetical protein
MPAGAPLNPAELFLLNPPPVLLPWTSETHEDAMPGDPLLPPARGGNNLRTFWLYVAQPSRLGRTGSGKAGTGGWEMTDGGWDLLLFPSPLCHARCPPLQRQKLYADDVRINRTDAAMGRVGGGRENAMRESF